MNIVLNAILYYIINDIENGPTGIWTRGLCLARAALSQSELRAHTNRNPIDISSVDGLVFDCHKFVIFNFV